MKEEMKLIKITDENGSEKEVEVIHYFTLDSNQKDYIVYTDNVVDENDDVLLCASEIEETEDKMLLKGIAEPEVVKEITKILSELLKD